MIFHIDGNAFYASCERVFRPDLADKAIAVLSNNDGIVVALNAECKALGFKRGDVFYEVKHNMEKKGVVVFSSNYTLYADMSARMNLIYNHFAPDVEVYSIDESFLFFPNWNTDYSEIGMEIIKTVKRDTGIPVSIGIAPNKTLAKMCNKLAKKHGGICNWQHFDKSGQDAELENYPVEDVWGIGYSKAKLLKRHGIHTALDLKNYPLLNAKKFLTITGFNTVQELNGITAIDKIEEKPRQAVMVSRSFQSPVYELDEIIAALSEYTQEAVNRIRAGGLSCKYVSVYLMTNAYAQGDQYFNSLSAELPYLSAYLPEIQSVANELLKRIFRPNYKYRKVMIGLTGLTVDNCQQFDLFDTGYNRKKLNEPLMRAFDTINERYGRGTIKLACGLGRQAAQHSAWEIRREYLSPRYTTNINEIPLVR
ncbi:MAG: Y-family DNA polymerase [Treponema sp.]|nr:Y-family DNA polymerase [Treponema sp.]MCL2251884.1 Y-family DNA polymerase [Treponema sp.]